MNSSRTPIAPFRSLRRLDPGDPRADAERHGSADLDAADGGPPDDALAGLVAAVAAGDAEAFERLYRLTSAKLFGLCLYMLKDREEASDVLQECFVSVWRSAGTFDGTRARAMTWLSTIARNRAIDRLRARRAVEGDDDLIASIVDDAPGPEDDAIRSDRLRRLWACIDGLGEKLRVLLVGCYFGGQTLPEIARDEGIPLGTAKSRMRLALARLKTCLDR